MPHIHLDARKPASLSALPWFPMARWDSASRVGAWLKRAAGPLALLCVVVHVILTCSSFRYTATLLVLDISPSWLLASCALLAFPSSLLFQQNASPVAPVNAGAKQPTPSELGSALRSLVLDDAPVTVSSDAGSSLAARGSGWNVARRLWKKVVQAAKAGVPQPTSSSRAPPSLRRQGQASALLQGRASMDSQSAGSPSGSGRSLWRQRSRGGGEGSRWAPSMTRITSGQHLAVMDDTSSSVASTSIASRRAEERAPRKDHGCDMPLVPHMGHLAVDCMQHDATLPHTEEITQVITSQHLLQFGALLGESSAELALSQAGLAAAQGKEPGCLMGATDNEAHLAQGWEQVAHEVCPRRGLHYCAWRRYLRKGLFMYKARTVFDGVTPQQLAAFHFDVEYKIEWDESCTQLMAIPPPRFAAMPSRNPTPPLSTSSGGATPTFGETTAPRLQPSFTSASAGGALDMSSGGGAALDWQDDTTEPALEWRSESSFARSSYMYARTRFPTPMAQREYIYARRVWAKADDGGCYMLSKIAPHPAPPAAGCRVVRVQDFVSGTVVRASAIGSGSGPAAEMITVYFEDSHVSSGIMNLGVRKALWPMVQKMEAALRKHVATAHGAALQVATSAALQQACLPRAGGSVPLRRCQSAAGSCRGSMDGSTGTASGGGAAPAAADSPARLQEALSLRLPARGPGSGAGKQVSWAGPAKKAASPLQQATAFTMSSPLKAAMQLVLAGYQRLAALLAALVGVLLTTLRCSLLAWLADAVWQLQYRIARAEQVAAARPGGARHVASHPVADDLLRGGSGDGGAGGVPPPTRSWRRKLAARLAMVAVRAVSLPLAHRMLARSSAASTPYPLSRSNSVSSSYGGATMVAQHGGRAGASGTQASMSESAARVRHWLDPATAPPGYMMGQQHTELMQHHVALQQLQARRQQQQGGGRSSGSTSAGGGLSLRPSLGALVVDGVPLAWERLPAAAAPEGSRMGENKGARNTPGAGQARGQHRGTTR